MRLFILLWCGLLLRAQPSPEALIEEGHIKRARAIVEAKYAANPNDAETLYLLSTIRQRTGDLAAARTLAEKAVAADPKNARYHFQLAETVGQEAEKASALKQIGLGRRFKKEIDATLALDPRHVAALHNLMEFYLMAPGILGGDKTKARAIPGQIKAIDPVKGYFAEADLARYDKQQERVDGLLRKAVEARPESYDAHLALASHCVNFAPVKLADAETHARAALKIDPTRVSAHVVLAGVMALGQRWSELDAELAQAEKDVPDNLSPRFRAASVCLAKGFELPRAEQYLRRYLSQDPEVGAPTHAVAHWRLGLILEKEGRKPDAVAEYQAAVKLDPNSPAKQELKRLK